MRSNGVYDFGPRLRKPSIKKEPTKLMKKSLKQLKKTRECYISMAIRYNNDEQGDDDDFVAKRDKKSKVVPHKTQQTHLEEPSHVTTIPQTNNLTHCSRLNNGMTSSLENTEKSMPCLSRILQKNTVVSRSSSSKTNTDVVSFRRTTTSSSILNNVMVCSQNDVKKSRSLSSSLNNAMEPKQKNTNGVAPRLKNIEKPRRTSARLNKGESSLSKNTEMPRSSSLNPKNDKISSRANSKNCMTLSKTTNSLVPLGKNSKSLKYWPSHLRNGYSSVLKDESNSDVSLLGKNLPSHEIAEISCMVSNMERHAESMNKHIQLDSRKRKTGLLKDGGIDGNKLKSTRMESLLEEKLETHNEVDICRSKKKMRRLIVHGDDEDDDGAQNLSCAKKGILGFTKSMDHSIQPKYQKTSLAEDGSIIHGKVRNGTDPSPGEKFGTHENDDSEETENCRPTKRRRRLILNDYEDNDDCDQNLAGTEIGIAGLTTQTVVAKDCPIEVSNPFLSESLRMQYYGSLPIDEPVWSGTFKISSNKNVPLAAHLSTKCCEEVWKFAGSLQPEIVATKLSRPEAWPKSFEASRPTDNDIALYFLPSEMRQDANLDQLVKEVVDNDMVLQVVLGEAEMLIFPSILLPEQHQTFQGKPYLWAVFKRRQNKVATVEAHQHGKGLEASEEVKRQGMVQENNPSMAQANASGPATKAPILDATMSANHGQIHSSFVVPTGALFGFVAKRTPRLEQLIQELQGEGVVVVAMQGEMIGSGLGQAI